MFPNRSLARQGQRGVALIITLAAVVLVSGVVLVFFTASTLNRKISFSSAGQYRADVTAHSALDTIVGDLRNEIIAGSVQNINGSPSTVNNIAVYVPTTNYTAIPSRIEDQGFPNVIKESAATNTFWSGSSYNSAVPNPIRSAASNNTSTASLNGRYIDSARWNVPYLLGAALPGNFNPPDWVVITRQGAIINAMKMPAVTGGGSLADKSGSNLNYAIGRYAYVIYNEGGLLDVNVAGYPNGSPVDFTSRRGVLPQVGLENIPGIDTIANANTLVTWRNQATASSVGIYTNYVLNATNGFTSVAAAGQQITPNGGGATVTVPAPGDQTFVSRQDLINYSKANPGTVSLSALQYLGTFTRSLNAPSYTPLPVSIRPVVASTFPAAGKDDQFNPSLVNARVSKQFIRTSDNTTAQVGEPLIKYRFPLSRLGLVTDSATADTSSLIYKYFGLTRGSSSNPWIYNHGTGNAIMNLSQVANAGREPDFFELLQAGISIGSLGQGLKGSPSTDLYAYDTSLYNQVIQIGANLVDQYDTDSYPTRITFNSIIFSGIENLPYISCVAEIHYSDAPKKYSCWYQPEIWNPHANPSTGSGTGPTLFKFITTGIAQSDWRGASATFYGGTINASGVAVGGTTFDQTKGITFGIDVNDTFSTPTILKSPNATATYGPDNSSGFLGIYIDSGTLPTTGTPTPTAPYASGLSESVIHLLQYQRNNTWITYSQFQLGPTPAGSRAYSSITFDPNYFSKLPTDSQKVINYEIHADPRSNRFGALTGYFLNGTVPNLNHTIRPDAGNGRITYFTTTDPDWKLTGSATSYIGYLSENLSSSILRYLDPDSQQRRADGAYVNGNVNNGGYPLAEDTLNNPSSRPVILNRPFRSVAEMGYAFRDEPWKHLDFFTVESADAALLDLFCLNESPPPPNPSLSTQPVALAGFLDLNTRQTPVLQAVLTGVIKVDETTTTVSSTDAGNLAQNLVSLTKTQPLLNRSELTTRWISNNSIASCFATPADATIKRRRESAIRALADVGNTRTWNLLIDVIAQSGKYSTSSKSLNDFITEGERRYWLHVAIDRYTGKVVSEYMEPVYE